MKTLIQGFKTKPSGSSQSDDEYEESVEEMRQKMLSPLGYWRKTEQSKYPSYIASAYKRMRGSED
jgi:hypothetical protein